MVNSLADGVRRAGSAPIVSQKGVGRWRKVEKQQLGRSAASLRNQQDAGSKDIPTLLSCLDLYRHAHVIGLRSKATVLWKQVF